MLLDKIKETGENLKMLQGHDRLQYLVDKAKDVEPLPEAAKIENNRIHGCASKLWIIGGADENNNMQYLVDGDAFITKGTAKVVTDIVNGEDKNEVAKLALVSSCIKMPQENLESEKRHGTTRTDQENL